MVPHARAFILRSDTEERDSYKDQSIVTLYLLAVLGLLLYAYVKPRMSTWAQVRI